MKIAPYIAIVFDGFFTIISLNIFLGYLHPNILESACVFVCLLDGFTYSFTSSHFITPLTASSPSMIFNISIVVDFARRR